MGGQLAGKINILHKGYANAASSLYWMFKTYTNPKTVAVMGWSAGAHLTNKLITFTNRFKAASSSAGAADWSDTNLGYRYGTKFREPFNNEDITKNILSLTQFR